MGGPPGILYGYGGLTEHLSLLKLPGPHGNAGLAVFKQQSHQVTLNAEKLSFRPNHSKCNALARTYQE